jgi:hypothetical protein
MHLTTASVLVLERRRCIAQHPCAVAKVARAASRALQCTCCGMTWWGSLLFSWTNSLHASGQASGGAEACETIGTGPRRDPSVGKTPQITSMCNLHNMGRSARGSGAVCRALQLL